MTLTLILLIFAVVCGFYVAWNIGANDVANAVGTSVGSGALTLKQAVLIAAIFEFAGAFLLGGQVSETVESGIVNPAIFSSDMLDYVFGMLGALLAAGAWLQIASYFGWPVSTTHSIVGAVLGFGVVLGGFEAIYWRKIGSILASWIISPLLGGGLAYLIFTMIRRKILYRINPVNAAKKFTPFLIFLIFIVLSLIILFDSSSHLEFLHMSAYRAAAWSIGIGLLSAVIAFFLVKRIKEPTELSKHHNLQVEIGLKKAHKHLMRVEAASLGDIQPQVQELRTEVERLVHETEVPEEQQQTEFQSVERIFTPIQVVMACFMSFAHGSNDVANAIGPLSAIVNILRGRGISSQSVPIWLLLLGGAGIVVGLATWGWRVIETVGRKITALTPSRGFAASFGAATTIVLASKLGLPISTTHVLVGAVLGVGFARGIGAINLNTIRDIVISWIVTVPAGAFLSVIFFYILRLIFT